MHHMRGDMKMASEQVEYCGNCKYYAECIKRANEGRLESCKLNK